MIQSYKYRLYPDRNTEARLAGALEQCRWLYNRLLEEIEKSNKTDNPLRMYDCHNLIPALKEERPELKTVYSKALQMVSQILWGNIRGLNELRKNGRKTGRIRFKGQGWYKTLNYNQSGFSVKGDVLTLSKIGPVKMNLHRPISGKVKGVIIKREDRCWYAIFQIETPGQPLPKNDKAVGIDVGIRAFAADSDCNSFENQKPLARKLESIKKAQKKLSRSKEDRRTGKSRRESLRNFMRRYIISVTTSCTNCPGTISTATGRSVWKI
ncbi:MAG TPA: transposase [Methanocella sp.]|nr:transposase [Methanocella sp.]